MDDNEDEKRDILNDYPDMYDKLHKEELGYRKGIQINVTGLHCTLDRSTN